MQVRQSIPHPAGVSVFGSALLRVPADVASIRLCASRLGDTPADALDGARADAERVRAFLEQAGVGSVQASRVTLREAWSRGKGQEFLGYRGSVRFHVVTRDLDRVEPIVVGAVDAGANGVDEIRYDTTELKEHRAMARAMAVESARRKAAVYCQAGGARLGPVIHIEDVNPDTLRRTRHVADHDLDAGVFGDESPGRAYDPGSIPVLGAVALVFRLLA